MRQPRSRKLIVFIGWVLGMILLCYGLPALLFLPLCWKQDHDLPPNTEVIVSACQDRGAFGVPGGDALFIYEDSGNMYLLDLRTGEKRDVPNDPLLDDYGVFLSSELVWLEGSHGQPTDAYYRPHYLLDLTDGQRYELLDLDWVPRVDGHFDPKYYAYFQSASQVFIHHYKNFVIALSSDFLANPNGRVILSGIPVGSEHGDLLEKLLQDLGVDYVVVDFSLRYTGVPSPTGEYIARNDGVYFSKTNILVMNHVGSYFGGWYYDDSGIIVQGGGYHLITLPGTMSYYYIPGTVFKMKMPAP